MAKWENAHLYTCKKYGTYPNIYIERCLHDGKRAIKIGAFDKNKNGLALVFPLRIARTLQKKLMQCIEGR